MTRYTDSDDDQQPLMWVREYAIYAAHFIVVVFVASMIATTLMMAANLSHILTWLTFDSSLVLQGQVWRVLTYGLVNPPSLGFAIDMVMIVWFGRELEKFFGRRIFLRFYVGLYLLMPVLFTLVGLRWPMHLAGETGALATFIAFATLYPNVMMLFNLLTKWVAIVLVAVYTLVALAYHDWVGLLSLWATTAYAYGFVCHEQGRFTLPSLRLPQRKPKLRVLPDLRREKTIEINATVEDSASDMDTLLDKIAKSGLASLTAKERSQLAKAREEMMQKKLGRS
jgi:membrane associated rhomboid family serine protease